MCNISNRGQPKYTDGFKGFHIMKYSSQIVIKKLDNKFIFNNKDDGKNLPQLIVEGKLDTSTKVNVEWINDNKWVKKHYQRKGMMQIFNDLYLYSSIKGTRSFREFEILNYLIISDFSTCKPLIGWVEYIGGILYRANLITENIPGMNFNDFLTSKDPVESILVRIYENIGSTIAKMHKLSIFHGDLNIGNIIVVCLIIFLVASSGPASKLITIVEIIINIKINFSLLILFGIISLRVKRYNIIGKKL